MHSGPVGLTGTNLTNLITVGLSETPGEAANGLGGLPSCLLRLIGGLSRSLLGLTCYLPCLIGGLSRCLLSLIGGLSRCFLGLTCYLPCLLGGLSRCLLSLIGGLSRCFLGLTRRLSGLLSSLSVCLACGVLCLLLGRSFRRLLGSLVRRILDTLLLSRLIH